MSKRISIDYRKRTSEPFIVFLVGDDSGLKEVGPAQWSKHPGQDETTEAMRRRVAEVAWAKVKAGMSFGQMVDLPRPADVNDAAAWLNVAGHTYFGGRA